MRNQILCAVLAVGATTGLAFGQNDRNKDREERRERREAKEEQGRAKNQEKNRRGDEAAAPAPAAPEAAAPAPAQPAPGDASQQVGRTRAERSLAGLYPGAKFEITQPKAVNGINVYDAVVHTPGGDTLAQVTDYGDFLVSGSPIPPEQAPAGVREATQDLLQGATTTDADALIATNYFVYLNSGKRQYQLRLDAAGRLLDIKSQSELRQEDPDKRMEKLPDSERQRLTKAAQTRYGGAKVTDMYRYHQGEGFALANVVVDGREGFVTVDPQGNVVSQRLRMEVGELPPPVTRTVNELFQGNKITHAERGETHYWQFERRVGDETLTMRLAATGDIVSLDSDMPVKEEEKAVVAGEKAKKANNKKNNKGGDGNRL